MEGGRVMGGLTCRFRVVRAGWCSGGEHTCTCTCTWQSRAYMYMYMYVAIPSKPYSVTYFNHIIFAQGAIPLNFQKGSI